MIHPYNISMYICILTKIWGWDRADCNVHVHNCNAVIHIARKPNRAQRAMGATCIKADSKASMELSCANIDGS
jgi:hypothetical protein